ncbi:MAG: hypothetical protein KDK39_11015 [Leptospiraceae bacterium]|nr:hypothetical protein [Leptospiraceae bacterium]
MSTEIKDQADLDLIRPFRDGYLPVIQKMQEYVEGCQSLLVSNILNTTERNLLNEQRSALDSLLGEMQKRCRVLAMEMTRDELDREAHRDYHNLFSGDADDHKLGFVVFLKSYVLLKRFSVQLSQDWTRLKKIILELDLHDKSEFVRQFLSYNAEPGIKLGEVIHRFCQRMKMILQLNRDPEDVRHLAGFAKYSPDLQYKLSTVYTENLESFITATFAQKQGDYGQLGIMPDLEHSEFEALNSNRSGSTSRTRTPPPDYKLDASGGHKWNQTRDYYLQYEPRALERERSIYKQVIYFDSHMGADQKFIRTDLIINLSRRKKSIQPETIESEYSIFLNNFFQLVNEISSMNMDISRELRSAFLFHLGPLAYSSLTLKFLQEVKTGYLHYRLQNGKMIRKFIPVELVRMNVLDFWKKEVLTKTDFDRNDYSIFRHIVKLVQSMHRQLMQKAEEEYQRLPPDMRKMRDRRSLFQENASSWIGATNIVIFKRFLSARQ